MGWKAIARSVMGTSHQDRKIPCQDYGDYISIDDDIIVGAVADGAGSAKYSHIGSRLAVEKTLSYLDGLLRWNKKENEGLRKPITPDIAKKTFDDTLTKVKEVLNEEAQGKGFSINDLACTLLVFCATPNWIAAMQIGDGFIVVKLKESNNYQLLFPPDKGEYANETTFVTSANASSRMKVDVISSEQQFICASTDGLERLAIDFRIGEASPKFFIPFKEGLRIRKRNEEEESVENWLNSDDVNARTDDDKTLLLCLYEEYDAKSQPDSDPQQVAKRLPDSKESDSHTSKPKEACPNKNQKSHTNISSGSQFLPPIQSFITVSFICHIFAGWILGISLSFLPLFIAVLLLTILVIFVTKYNLVNYLVILQLPKWLQKIHKKLVAVTLSSIFSILGISLGLFSSKLSSSRTLGKTSTVNILQPINNSKLSSEKKVIN